jgi:hypothetical protein
VPCDASPVLRSRRGGVLLAALALASSSAAPARARADAAPRSVALGVALDPAARAIAGSVEIAFENTATVALDEIALVLYPNRFARPEPGIDDLNRPFVYPREELVPGAMVVESVEVRSGAADAAFQPALALRPEAINGWSDTLLRARLAAPLAPGAPAQLRARFRTVLPERFGLFGATEGGIVAVDGWCPTLAPLAADGTWRPGALAPPVAVRGELRAPGAFAVVLGSEVRAAGGGETIGFADAGAACPPLLASETYRFHEREIDGLAVRLAELPPRRALAFPLPRPRPHAAVVLETVEEIVRARPDGLAPPPAALLVAEAPLRLELVAPARPGVAVVSDRILRLHRLVRDFHARELAAAIYGALVAGRIAARETAADAPWVTEAVAAELADRYLAGARPRHRTVYDWIGLFDLFAIVDRFETAPKIPFTRAFFPEARHADALADGVESFARDRPPGRTILTKLRNAIGAPAAAAAVDRYLAGSAPFRDVAAAVGERPLDRFFAQWTAPHPEVLDYAVVDADLNRPDDAGGYRHRVTVEARASRPVHEPVEVELEETETRVTWDAGDAARDAADAVTTRETLALASAAPARRVMLDPDRRLLEDSRRDNARARRPQLVLDSADVTVTSSEFAISGLFVGRWRYDYTKDVGLITFFSDRGTGLHVGPRLHFGAPNDATTYRHNLFGFYTFADLRGDFQDDSRPGFRTDGRLGGFGLRYDYGDELSYDNPTDATKVRLFGEWYDGALGSSFDYAQWGARASFVRPLLGPRTLVALQLMNAFSATTGDGPVPNQGRYSLGGDLAVRGIAVDERLGENVALARVELRRTVSAEMDWNAHDILVLRRGQLRFFVDSGRVEDRRSSLYRVSDFAVGIGVGAAAFYDFMGFYPAVAYVAVAGRVDRFDGVDNDVQFLFGTRQAF